MQVVVDKDRMCVTYRYANPVTLRYLCHIELAHSHVVQFDETCEETLNTFSMYELLQLYTSMTGQTFSGFHRPKLTEKICKLFVLLPTLKVHPFQVVLQALSILPRDKSFFRFQENNTKPIECDTLYLPPGLRILSQAEQIQEPLQRTVAISQQLEAAVKYPPPWK